MNRAQLIGLHVDECIRREPMKKREFARRVREHYEMAVPPEYRTIEFSNRSDVFDRQEADKEKLFMMLDNTQRRRLPVEVEESIIAALPESRRFRLQVMLGERENVLVVPMPNLGKGAEAESLGRLSKEIGDVFQQYGHLLLDNEINEHDRARAPGAITDINEAIAVLVEMREAVDKKALGGGGNVVLMEKKR